MGLSIANTMSPFMGRGAPMTVIKGAFAPALVSGGSSLYYRYPAFAVSLGGLATSTSGFQFKIKGRCRLGDYESSAGLTSVGTPSDVNTNYEQFPQYEEYHGRRYDGYVRLVDTRLGDHVQYNIGSTAASAAAAEEQAHSDLGEIGAVVAPDVSIVIYGRLATLDPRRIVAAGLRADGVPVIGSVWYKNYYVHTWPAGPKGNGWRTFEVHIFDNPQLAGHVDTWDYTKVFWDC